MTPRGQLVARVVNSGRRYFYTIQERLFSRFPTLQRRRTLATCALVVGLISGFLLGARYFGSEMSEKREIAASLEDTQQHVHQLELDKTELTTNLQVDQATAKRLSSMLFKLEEDLANARDELRLYKSLMGDTSDQQMPTARALRVRMIETDRYAYLLALEQGKSSKGKNTSVYIAMSLVGFKGDESFNISIRDLDENFPAEDEAVSIRYFKMIEGEFTLPASMTPTEVVVDVRHQGNKEEVISRRFPWK